MELSERIITNLGIEEVMDITGQELRKIAETVNLIDSGFTFVLPAGFCKNRYEATIRPTNNGYLLTSAGKISPNGSFYFLFIVLLFTAVLWIIVPIVYIIEVQRLNRVIDSALKSVATEINNQNAHSELVSARKDIDFEQIEKLASLHEKGIITDDEFDRKKAELLS